MMIYASSHTTQNKVRTLSACMKILTMMLLAPSPGAWAGEVSTDRLPYAIVDTAQVRCYSNNSEIACPRTGSDFFGQDAQYIGNEPAYRDNQDGTITDLITGLMWQGDPGDKIGLWLWTGFSRGRHDIHEERDQLSWHA